MKTMNLPNYISRQGATFETTENFIKSSVPVDTTADRLEYTGIPLAQIGENMVAASKEELHVFVVGETGSGKTRRAVLPSIALMAKTGESMVIPDAKGELYRSASAMLKKKRIRGKRNKFQKSQ